MSPLIIEIYSLKEERWIQLPCLKPGERTGSVSNNKSNGSRELYLFGCSLDDSCSTIYRSKKGLDVNIKDLREVVSEELEVVKKLRKNERYELLVKTDISSEKKEFVLLTSKIKLNIFHPKNIKKTSS